MKERKEQRDEINETISEFLLTLFGCSARLGECRRRSEMQRPYMRSPVISSFFLPLFVLSPQPRVVKSEGGPR